VSANRLVIVGTVIKPHGIKGEVAVEISSDSPNIFRASRQFILRRKNGPELVLEIAAVRFHHGRALISFKGIDDRNAADELRQYDLLIAADDLPQPEPDEFYHYEVLDSTAMDSAGQPVGTVTGILETGPAVLVEIRTASGTFLLPFVDQYIERVDRQRKTVVIRNYQPLMTLDSE
jgi:16S rRNA processing protein RimM